MGSLTEHGGRTDYARALYPDAPLPWLDLSTGINSVAWAAPPGLVVDHCRLPSRAALEQLEAAAASFFGTTSDRVAALPGTELGLRLLRDIGMPAPYHHVAPSYATHAAIFTDTQAITIDALANIAMRGGTLLLANPNNPDGRVLAPARLHDIARHLEQAGGRLVIDEAFADVSVDTSIVPLLNADDTTIVLRSFGKFFGLAGVRLGFVIADRTTLHAIRQRLGSWPVSATALAFGTAAYRDTSWIAATRRDLTVRAAIFDDMLARHGLEPMGGCPLFRLIDCDAPALVEQLARSGILTRPFTHDVRRVRFGVPGSDAELARLDAALRG